MAIERDDGRVPVLLLKTKSVPHDGYEHFFSTASDHAYAPVFIPVLNHRLRSEALEKIRGLIEEKAFSVKDGKYGGIIFTSQRAVAAFVSVIEELRATGVQSTEARLFDVPLYVVGQATARSLRELNLRNPILGENTGNAELLAHFILEDFNKRRSNIDNTGMQKPKLLFLVGEQRRDTLPRMLQSDQLTQDHRIGVDELVVYETEEMESFRSDFESACVSNWQSSVSVQWVVVFSPAGCKVALESIGKVTSKTGPEVNATDTDTKAHQSTRTFVATIGPTTQDYLSHELDFHADVCAPKPSPEHLGEAIQRFMSTLKKNETMPYATR